jgi:hypothetical protein
MDAEQIANQPTILEINTYEALLSYLPPSNFVFPLRDGQTTTAFTPMLWAVICNRYAQGEPLEIIAKENSLPPSLIWRWSSLPALAPIWADVRKMHSHSLVDKASYATHSLNTGEFFKKVFQSETDGKIDPSGGVMRALVRAQLEAGKLAMEVAAKINPDDYSDRLQVDKRSVSAVYVVAYQSGHQPGHEPAIDAPSQCLASVPAPDKSGVERAALPQRWRKAIAKERKLKTKGMITD